jgi:hypothetical protein
MGPSIRWRQVLRAVRGDRLDCQGQVQWSLVPTKPQSQRGSLHGFLELYSSGWMLKVTGRLPRPGRPEAPNAPRCSRLRDRRGWPNPPFPHNHQPAPLAASLINSPNPSRWLSHLYNQERLFDPSRLRCLAASRPKGFPVAFRIQTRATSGRPRSGPSARRRSGR